MYERYLGDPGYDAKRKPEVDAVLAELYAQIARLRVEVKEPGVQVLVNGRLVGESPQQLSLRVEPGSYTIVAQKQGFPVAVATVAVQSR